MGTQRASSGSMPHSHVSGSAMSVHVPQMKKSSLPSPMNCTFGLIDPLPVVPGGKRIRNKTERYEAIARRSLDWLQNQYPKEETNA